MAVTVCNQPGCPELTTSAYCEAHTRDQRRAENQQRGTFRQRGYDHKYDKNRKRLLTEETHCWICGRPVDTALKYPDPFSPSADHVTPRSRGGTNERQNLKLAHLRCNTSRQAK